MDEHLEQRDIRDFLAEEEAKWNAMSAEEREALIAANKAANEEYERKNAGKSIEQIFGEGMAESLGKPDWLYGDLPKLTREYFDKFIELVGEENIQWITYAEYPANFAKWNNPEPLYRGQYLVSPDGQARAKKYTDSLS